MKFMLIMIVNINPWNFSRTSSLKLYQKIYRKAILKLKFQGLIYKFQKYFAINYLEYFLGFEANNPKIFERSLYLLFHLVNEETEWLDQMKSYPIQDMHHR